MIDLNLDQLQQAAEAATKGPWFAVKSSEFERRHTMTPNYGINILDRPLAGGNDPRD